MVDKSNDTEMSILNSLTDDLKLAIGEADCAKLYKDEVIEAVRKAQDYIDGQNRAGFKSYSGVEEVMADIEKED